MYVDVPNMDILPYAMLQPLQGERGRLEDRHQACGCVQQSNPVFSVGLLDCVLKRLHPSAVEGGDLVAQHQLD
jgi:hypothetical protein